MCFEGRCRAIAGRQFVQLSRNQSRFECGRRLGLSAIDSSEEGSDCDTIEENTDDSLAGDVSEIPDTFANEDWVNDVALPLGQRLDLLESEDERTNIPPQDLNFNFGKNSKPIWKVKKSVRLAELGESTVSNEF